MKIKSTVMLSLELIPGFSLFTHIWSTPIGTTLFWQINYLCIDIKKNVIVYKCVT